MNVCFFLMKIIAGRIHFASLKLNKIFPDVLKADYKVRKKDHMSDERRASAKGKKKQERSPVKILSG